MMRGEEEKASADLDKASTSLLSGSSSGNRPSKKTVEGITPLNEDVAAVDRRRDANKMDVGEIETELEKLKKSIRTSDLFAQKKTTTTELAPTHNDSWQDTVLVSPQPQHQDAKSMDSEEEATMIQEILEDESNRTQKVTNDDDSDSDDMFCSATPGTIIASLFCLNLEASTL